MGTSIKTVNGMVSDGYKVGKSLLTIRFTSDRTGESLSLEYNGQIMLLVDYKDVEAIVKKARKSR